MSSISDMLKAFIEHCSECKFCSDCKLYGSGTTIGRCVDAYFDALDSGKMTLEDSFVDNKQGGQNERE